jgi:hypothetical protein
MRQTICAARLIKTVIFNINGLEIQYILFYIMYMNVSVTLQKKKNAESNCPATLTFLYCHITSADGAACLSYSQRFTAYTVRMKTTLSMF